MTVNSEDFSHVESYGLQRYRVLWVMVPYGDIESYRLWWVMDISRRMGYGGLWRYRVVWVMEILSRMGYGYIESYGLWRYQVIWVMESGSHSLLVLVIYVTDDKIRLLQLGGLLLRVT